jgi:signal transduction histidine kinase
MNMLVSGVALLLACAGFGALDLVSSRDAIVQNLSAQAQIIGANSVSALVFDDPHTAETTLSALSAIPNVMSGGIYATDGRLFAGYRRNSDNEALQGPPIPAGQDQSYRLHDLQIELVRRVIFQGKQVGTIYLQSDLHPLFARFLRNGVVAGLMFCLSLIVALILSRRTQRAISDPLVRLAETARLVSDEKNYSVRATSPKDNYELAILIEAFNDMLAQIEKRDQSLQDARQSLEARVQERTAELNAANKELEAFSYSVSHDLRAPLRHVLGFSEMLQQRAGEQLDEKSRHYLQTMTGAATKMGVLIDDLLAFSRTGRTELAKQRVPLAGLVQEARMEVANDVAGRRVEWIVHPLPEVDADPSMLRLVLINLLSNAIKYTATREVAQIEVGMEPVHNGECVFYIRDNGVGFDMQYAGKLFGVFQRLHAADEFAGTGIGLANVRRIVHRHGGRTWAEAQVDRGATFYFSLPATRAS